MARLPTLSRRTTLVALVLVAVLLLSPEGVEARKKKKKKKKNKAAMGENFDKASKFGWVPRPPAAHMCAAGGSPLRETAGGQARAHDASAAQPARAAARCACFPPRAFSLRPPAF